MLSLSSEPGIPHIVQMHYPPLEKSPPWFEAGWCGVKQVGLFRRRHIPLRRIGAIAKEMLFHLRSQIFARAHIG